jgi:hypothetical protein
MSTIGAVLVAALAGTLTVTAMMDWVVVDVEVPEDSVNLTVPFPLVLGRAAAAFIPEDVTSDVDMSLPPELVEQKELVLATMRSLLEAPDATLVTVDADDAQVEVRKEGDDLLVSVDADDATVRCKVPLDGLVKALDGWDWQSFDPGMAFDIMSAVNGEMVRVEVDDGTKVALRIW